MAHDDEPRALVALLALAVALYFVDRLAQPTVEPPPEVDRDGAVAVGSGYGCLACVEAGGSGSGLIVTGN